MSFRSHPIVLPKTSNGFLAAFFCKRIACQVHNDEWHSLNFFESAVFFIFTFRMGRYLNFNAPSPPSTISQYAVGKYGLLRECLLGSILLTKILAFEPF